MRERRKDKRRVEGYSVRGNVVTTATATVCEEER